MKRRHRHHDPLPGYKMLDRGDILVSRYVLAGASVMPYCRVLCEHERLGQAGRARAVPLITRDAFVSLPGSSSLHICRFGDSSSNSPNNERVPSPSIKRLVVRKMWLVRQELFDAWNRQTPGLDGVQYGLNWWQLRICRDQCLAFQGIEKGFLRSRAVARRRREQLWPR